MFKGVITGVVSTLAFLLLALFGLIKSGHISANADGTPSALEVWVASTSLSATMHRLAPQNPNPITATEQNLSNGVQLYAQNCAICHGSASGAASASPIAKGLFQKPPQLATEGVEDDPEGESFWKIKHGIRLTGMPSFAQSLSDEEIWTLALFLKHMDKLPPVVQQSWQQVRNWPLATR
jgi:thiosulfate dehydrogenase